MQKHSIYQRPLEKGLGLLQPMYLDRMSSSRYYFPTVVLLLGAAAAGGGGGDFGVVRFA
jgi:hypothetical protein